jgi:hypothetical protein
MAFSARVFMKATTVPVQEIADFRRFVMRIAARTTAIAIKSRRSPSISSPGTRVRVQPMAFSRHAHADDKK